MNAARTADVCFAGLFLIAEQWSALVFVALVGVPGGAVDSVTGERPPFAAAMLAAAAAGAWLAFARLPARVQPAGFKH